VRLADLAHRSVLDELEDTAELIGGHALITHLGCHFLFLGDLSQGTSLCDIVSHGLLDVDRLAALHGSRGDQRVIVVRGSHDDSVDLTTLVLEQFAEVLVLRHTGQPASRLSQTLFVHIAEGNETMTGYAG
jgi:hypothetical protein